MKRIENIKTLKEAEDIAAKLRREGFRVGVSGQTAPDGSYTGLFVVTAKGGSK
jgi:hypothetical protein